MNRFVSKMKFQGSSLFRSFVKPEMVDMATNTTLSDDEEEEGVKELEGTDLEKEVGGKVPGGSGAKGAVGGNQGSVAKGAGGGNKGSIAKGAARGDHGPVTEGAVGGDEGSDTEEAGRVDLLMQFAKMKIQSGLNNLGEPSNAKQSRNPKDVLQISPEMNKLDNWILDWIPESVDVRETLRVISSVFTEKFSNFTAAMLLKELESMPHETISYYLIRTFCQICNHEDMLSINEGMETTKKLISRASEKKLVHIDHCEGLVFLFAGLTALKMTLIAEMVRNKEHNQEHIAAFLESCARYENLPPLGKVSVLATKAMFLGSCRQYEEQLALMEEVVKKDPDTLEWKLCYYLAMRTWRKRLTFRRGGPGRKEATLLEQCHDQAPLNVMVMLANCLYMSDYVKTNWPNAREPATLLHGIQFSRKEHVFDYIRREIRVILAKMKHSARVHLFIVEMFTSGLPYYLRDNELAVASLQKALEINPKSSKANHRMAVMLIFERNYAEAVPYLLTALEADFRNYPALLDYTNISLRDPKANIKELNRIFDKVVDSCLPNETIGAMMAMNGIYKFMLGRTAEALSAWSFATAFVEVEPMLTMKTVDKMAKRFQWDPESCSIEKLYKFFTDVYRNEILTLDDRSAINNWIIELEVVISDERKRMEILAIEEFHRNLRAQQAAEEREREELERERARMQAMAHRYNRGGYDHHRREHNDQVECFIHQPRFCPPRGRGFRRPNGRFQGHSNGSTTTRDPVQPTGGERGFQRGRGRGYKGNKSPREGASEN